MFPTILAILFDLLRDVEPRDRSRASLPAAPPPRLVSPHVVSHSLMSDPGSAPLRPAGSSTRYNTREYATCPVHFRGITGTAFRPFPIPPHTCRSRPPS